MKPGLTLKALFIGLAFFSVLFGAGNIIFPLQIGAVGGNKALFSFLGYLISGIGLPLLGLIGATLFEGDYKKFFYRIGKIPGSILVFLCMLAIGPAIGIPRVVTLAHEMLPQVLSKIPLFWFSFAFLLGTFLIGIYKKCLITILSIGIAPLLLLCTITFIGMGMATLHPAVSDVSPSKPILAILGDAIALGYNTLDMIAALFFASFFLTMLKNAKDSRSAEDVKEIESIGFTGSYIGISILAIITIGFCLLGIWYGNMFEQLPTERLFTAITKKLFGTQSVILTTATVLLACSSTILGISAVAAQYIQELTANRLKYPLSLAIILAAAFIPSSFGLENILLHSGPIINLVYPTVIALVICNILYKLVGFEHVKLPTFIVFATVMMHYIQKMYVY